MLTDRYGLPINTSSTIARDAYSAGVDCVLSAAHGAEAHLSRVGWEGAGCPLTASRSWCCAGVSPAARAWSALHFRNRRRPVRSSRRR